MTYGPVSVPRVCPRCGAAVPLANLSAGSPLRATCVVCKAELEAPGDPGSALVEAMTGVLGGITGSPFTGEKRPKR